MTRYVHFAILSIFILGVGNVASAAGQGNGYAWANQQNAAGQYQPNTSYSWNSANRAISANRSGTGTYTISFIGLGGHGTPGGHAQVSAYGPGNEYCKVISWDSKGENFIVNVHCFNPAGQPENSQFVVRVGWPEQPVNMSVITPDNSRFFDAPDNVMPLHQTRSINRDGRIVINYSDGRIMERFFGGTTTILPNGQQMTALHVEIMPDEPASRPGNAERTWLLQHNENLYEIIKHLVNNDEQALKNYKHFEGRDKSIYNTIAIRQKTISLLAKP